MTGTSVGWGPSGANEGPARGEPSVGRYISGAELSTFEICVSKTMNTRSKCSIRDTNVINLFASITQLDNSYSN